MPNEIFIENLHFKVDASMLINLFKREGRIISCNIDVDKHFASVGNGYVVFDNPSSAHHAVEIMNGQSFHGRKIKVSLKSSKVFDDETVVDYYTKVFVKNISPLWDDCDLMMEFQEFGGIRAAQISMTEGKSNYFGFVIFNKHSSAKAAVMSKHSYLVVKPYIPKPKRSKMTSSDTVEDILKRSTQYNNLHVKNIPEDMDDSALEELFERFGTITSVKVARDQSSGKSLRFGFVCFVSDMDAEEARSAMNGYILNSKPLVVNFHQKKEARKQYLEKRNSDNGGWVEKYIGGKEKDFIEKDAERKEKDFIEKGAERKEKSVEKKEKYIERVEKGIEGKEKGTERKEKSTKRKKDKMRKETCSSKPYYHSNAELMIPRKKNP